MGNKKSKIGQCVYCGETKSLTKDHVIARCLFPAPLPTFMATVPACNDCNAAKAKHDDYLRDMLVVDHNSEHSKPAHTLLAGKVLRASKRNQSLVIRGAKSKGKFGPIYSKGGIYLGDGLSVPLEGERVNHIFSLIVRGLYYKLTGRFLPQDATFDVRRLRVDEFNKSWEKLKEIGFNGPYRLGEDVFTCIFLYAEEEPAISQWWLWFYDSVCVYVTTTPSNYDPATLTASTEQ